MGWSPRAARPNRCCGRPVYARHQPIPRSLAPGRHYAPCLRRSNLANAPRKGTGNPIRQKAQHLSGYSLHVVFAARDDCPDNLVLEQDFTGNGELVLNTIHPFDHFEVKVRPRMPRTLPCGAKIVASEIAIYFVCRFRRISSNHSRAGPSESKKRYATLPLSRKFAARSNTSINNFIWKLETM